MTPPFDWNLPVSATPVGSETDPVQTAQRAIDERISLFSNGAEFGTAFGVQYKQGYKGRGSWMLADLQSGWVRYDNVYPPARYMKDDDGTVYLDGLVKNGTAAPSVIFALPPECSPENRTILTTLTSPDVVGRVDVLPTGLVYAQVGSTTYFNLSGLSFKAAA